MDNLTITRKELYDLVWSTPMTTLAKKYLISDSGIRKKCKKMNIPMPKAGHWEKLRAGKNALVEILPNDTSCEQQTSFELRHEGDNSTKDKPSPEILLKEEIEKDPLLNIIVPDKLTKPHRLVVESRKADYYNENSFRKNLTGYLRSPLNISATKNNYSRALRIMDTFIKAIEYRGHKFEITNDTAHLLIFGEEFGISIREKNNKKPKPKTGNWQEYEYIPSGILAFSVRIRWNNIEWKDGKLPLEQQLSKIIAKLEIKGAEEKEETLRRKEILAIREEEKRIEKEKAQLVTKELEKFKQLKQAAQRWHEANMIRAYLDALKQKDRLSKPSGNSELANWLIWANNKADWFDPNTNIEDELLNDADSYSFDNEEKNEMRYIY